MRTRASARVHRREGAERTHFREREPINAAGSSGPAAKILADTMISTGLRPRRLKPATASPRVAPEPSGTPPSPIVSRRSSLENTDSTLPLLRAAGVVDFDEEQNAIVGRKRGPPGGAAVLCKLGNGNVETETVEVRRLGVPRNEFEEEHPAESARGGVTGGVSPKLSNEFSDHSDTENEFGRLPESVFEAIEDTEDGRSSDGGRESPGAARPSADTPGAVGRRPGKVPSSRTGRTRTAGKKLACEECNKTFAREERLAIHRRTHTKERPFPCRVCDKAFGAAAGRYIHERTHSARREHACGACGRAFRWRAALARHEARHAAARAHECAACGRGFNLRADLARHARAHRPGRHPCPLCGERFKQERYLKVHVQNIHYARNAPADTPAESTRTVFDVESGKRAFKTPNVRTVRAAPAFESESSLSPIAHSDS